MQILKITEEGLNLIKEFERFCSIPYKCQAGVPTIGFGTIRYPNGKDVTMSDPQCTEEDAEEWLKRAVGAFETILNAFLNKNSILLNPHQFSALISFVYNLGAGPILSTDSTIHKGLVSKNPEMVCFGMSLYNKVRIDSILQVSKGLKYRREKEIDLFKKEYIG